ncbi:MAG: site-2 protease family protein [Clostridia bacterium]|nr:site-2 protease family protein [Clostridia bacterium]
MLTAVVTVLIFLVMISLHEFGHFIMAKASGVSVLEFAVGMGPAIFKKQGKETLYSIRIFPIGGYCKLDGEDGGTDNPRAFCNQKLWKRFLVVSAGAVLNIILGFVLVVIMVSVQPHSEGQPNMISTPVIDSLVDNSHISETGIQPGDRIVDIDGHKIHIYDEIRLYTSKLEGNEIIPITVERNGKKIKFDVKPSLSETIYEYGENSVIIKSVINGVENKEEIEYTDEIRESVRDVIGQTASEKRYLIGFVSQQQEVTVFNVIPYAYHYTGYVIKMVYRALWDMITGKTGFDEVSGPVGIISAVNTAVNTNVKYRLVNILSLASILTINLGIFNLLPLPALDGGRLFFMLVELLRRKPVPPEKEGMVHAIGLMLLLLLSVVISYHDIMKLFVR